MKRIAAGENYLPNFVLILYTIQVVDGVDPYSNKCSVALKTPTSDGPISHTPTTQKDVFAPRKYKVSFGIINTLLNSAVKLCSQQINGKKQSKNKNKN